MAHRGLTLRGLGLMGWRIRWRLQRFHGWADVAGYLVALCWLGVFGWLWKRDGSRRW